MKDSIYQIVQNAFISPNIANWLNETLICLILKGKIHETINANRPISLCNTILKVISKIVLNKLRPLL